MCMRTMRTKLKRVLQALTLVVLTAYMGQMLIGSAPPIQLAGQLVSPNDIEFNDGQVLIVPTMSSAVGIITQVPLSTDTTVSSSSSNDENTRDNDVHKDVFISVKTTKSFHKSRLDVVLKTWFSSAREQTYFFTDGEDDELQRRTGGHLINTNCTSSHNRKALCCKMSVEFDTFIESNKMWFCHFDDDNYVNIPRLMQMLRKYSPQEDWYLGKPSIRAPLHIMNRDNPQGPKISFWFATGGAGFCISRALALKMMPLASNGKFISIGDKIRLPDDVTMGYIVEHLLKHNLTVIKEFHSHLEPMKFLQPEQLPEQISFSYSTYGKELNVVSIEGISLELDPTRFLSLHCHLFPSYSYCPR